MSTGMAVSPESPFVFSSGLWKDEAYQKRVKFGIVHSFYKYSQSRYLKRNYNFQTRAKLVANDSWIWHKSDTKIREHCLCQCHNWMLAKPCYLFMPHKSQTCMHHPLCYVLHCIIVGYRSHMWQNLLAPRINLELGRSSISLGWGEPASAVAAGKRLQNETLPHICPLHAPCWSTGGREVGGIFSGSSVYQIWQRSTRFGRSSSSSSRSSSSSSRSSSSWARP